jgi:hypothetical protein
MTSVASNAAQEEYLGPLLRRCGGRLAAGRGLAVDFSFVEGSQADVPKEAPTFTIRSGCVDYPCTSDRAFSGSMFITAFFEMRNEGTMCAADVQEQARDSLQQYIGLQWGGPIYFIAREWPTNSWNVVAVAHVDSINEALDTYQPKLSTADREIFVNAFQGLTPGQVGQVDEKQKERAGNAKDQSATTTQSIAVNDGFVTLFLRRYRGRFAAGRGTVTTIAFSDSSRFGLPAIAKFSIASSGVKYVCTPKQAYSGSMFLTAFFAMPNSSGMSTSDIDQQERDSMKQFNSVAGGAPTFFIAQENDAGTWQVVAAADARRVVDEFAERRATMTSADSRLFLQAFAVFPEEEAIAEAKKAADVKNRKQQAIRAAEIERKKELERQAAEIQRQKELARDAAAIARHAVQAKQFAARRAAAIKQKKEQGGLKQKVH